jgi:hypothetical protein
MKFLVLVSFLCFVLGNESVISSQITQVPTQGSSPASIKLSSDSNPTNFMERKVSFSADDTAPIQQVLLRKYQALAPEFAAKDTIDFKEVRVLGWPEDVVFFCSEHWRDPDRESLHAHLHEINFTREYRKFNECDLQEKMRLHERLEAVSEGYTASKTTIPWLTRFKDEFPDLHMSTKTPSLWNGQDLLQVRTIIAIYEKDFATIDRLHFQQFAIDLEGALLQKYCEAVGDFGREIDWLRVKVTGWAQGVLFCSLRHWQQADVIILKRYQDKIRLEAAELPALASNFDALLGRFLELFTHVNDEIDWDRVIEKWPGIHLSTPWPEQWIASDYAQIQENLEIEALSMEAVSILGKRFTREF